jgi:hypothetical protein
MVIDVYSLQSKAGTKGVLFLVLLARARINFFIQTRESRTIRTLRWGHILRRTDRCSLILTLNCVKEHYFSLFTMCVLYTSEQMMMYSCFACTGSDKFRHPNNNTVESRTIRTLRWGHILRRTDRCSLESIISP